MEEMDALPRQIEEIKVVYRKDPTTPVVDLVLYVNEILNA
jgi:hypothetical protein